jgi:hypothetical protein
MSPVLQALLKRLTENPGLHVGVVAVRGAGLQLMYSARHYLKPPVQDRGPKFVSEGSMRLECLTSSSPEGAPRFHYLTIVLLGHATKADLDLGSRRVTQTPWGITVGMVTSVNPNLYAVGASYKLRSSLELFAGVGVRKDNPTSFVYGLSIDVKQILDAVFGAVKGGGE